MVDLVRAGRTPESLGEEFEPSAQAIRNWVRQVDRDEGRRPDGLTTAERDELRKLRRDNARLREEREILKNCPTGGTVSCRDRNSRTAYAAKQPRGAAVCFLVALTPLTNLALGRLRTCEW